MTIRIGINGFGRIGRLAVRGIASHDGIELAHINDLKADAATAASRPLASATSIATPRVRSRAGEGPCPAKTSACRPSASWSAGTRSSPTPPASSHQAPSRAGAGAAGTASSAA